MAEGIHGKSGSLRMYRLNVQETRPRLSIPGSLNAVKSSKGNLNWSDIKCSACIELMIRIIFINESATILHL